MRQAEQEIYEELADKYDRQGDARQRDLFLVLAADAAFSAGSADQAERLRLRLLELSPHHLLRGFANFADALRSSDIQDYLVNLRRQFPPAQLLASLGSPFPPGTPREPPVFRQPVTFSMQEPSSGAAPRFRRVPGEQPVRAFPFPGRNEQPQTPGELLTVLLFVLLLIGALALAGWTIVRPLW